MAHGSEGRGVICARCQQPILPGEDYEALDKFSDSAAGVTLHVHKTCPPKQDR